MSENRLMEMLQARRSVRKYTAEQISDEKIDRILQAGLLAPSSRALFPVEFIVVREKATLLQLSRAKTAGSGMLKHADAAIVVIGDTARSDAWIEDCSLAMIYMQLEASDLGIGNCWVQCRGRVSQQKKGEPIGAASEDVGQAMLGVVRRTEDLVAAMIAGDKNLKDNLSTDDFLRSLLGIPEHYSVEAILSLGMPDQTLKPRELPEIDGGKVHRGKY